jgi:nitrous oxide reductase accessory protein NosL
VSGQKKQFVDETFIAKVGPVRSSFLEEELYVEPTQMGLRDTLGVVAALIALAVIGVSGYVWLNPQLDSNSFLAFEKRPDAPLASSAAEAGHIACPYCGMYADQSDGAVAVMWVGGGSGTFDSFDCLFNYITENKVKLKEGTVLDYASHEQADSWIGFEQATYLYGTTEMVSGSMEPYVAAFGSKQQAEEAKKTMGGEVVDFAGLQRKWK